MIEDVVLVIDSGGDIEEVGGVVVASVFKVGLFQMSFDGFLGYWCYGVFPYALY